VVLSISRFSKNRPSRSSFPQFSCTSRGHSNSDNFLSSVNKQTWANFAFIMTCNMQLIHNKYGVIDTGFDFRSRLTVDLKIIAKNSTTTITLHYKLIMRSTDWSIVNLYNNAVAHQQVMDQRRWKYDQPSVKKCDFRRQVKVRQTLFDHQLIATCLSAILWLPPNQMSYNKHSHLIMIKEFISKCFPKAPHYPRISEITERHIHASRKGVPSADIWTVHR